MLSKQTFVMRLLQASQSGVAVDDTLDGRRRELAERFPAWPSRTIAQHLDSLPSEFMDRVLVFSKDRSFTYRTIHEWSRRIAAGLVANGIRPGDRVAINLANSPEFVALKFAIDRAAAVCVPCNFLLRGSELEYVLDQSGASMLVTMDVFRGHDYLADLPRPRHLKATFVVTMGEASTTTSRFPTLDALELSGTSSAPEELNERSHLRSGSDLADIIYTSGTTGRSKGVELTHDMILRSAYSSALTRAFGDGHRILFAMPMYHVFGYVECLMAATFVGGAIIPQRIFDPGEMLDAAEAWKANEIVCVPVMTAKLIELARVRGFDGTHLELMFNSGGVNSPSIWQEIQDVLRPRGIITAYGMTETTASTTCTLPEDGRERLLNTNGRYKLAGNAGDEAIGSRIAEYKAINPVSGAEMPAGEEGELVVRGPVVTHGYFEKPEETAASFTPDGWLRTGDLGRIGADGYLVLTGRLKETYRCNGEMVTPSEIEALFTDDPEIEQALAVGVPDARSGEAGCLCVVPREGHRPDQQQLIDRCKANLARFKVPRHVLFLNSAEIPLTVTGRPQKFKLAKLATERLGQTLGSTR